MRPPRWIVTVTYRTNAGPLDVVHDVEELAEVADMIECGPDWNTIEQIVIVLNPARRSHCPTVEDMQNG